MARTDAHAMMLWMVAAHAVFGAAFAWIYYQGREDKPWLAQGVRFGLAVAALAIVPIYLIYHVVTPVPLAVAIKQIVFDTVRVVVMGVVVSVMVVSVVVTGSVVTSECVIEERASA